MTLEEAMKAMQTHRVRHSSWNKDKWCTMCTNGIIYFSGFTWMHLATFEIIYSILKEGWEIIPNPERSVG